VSVLLVDAGNTRVKGAVYTDGTITPVFQIETPLLDAGRVRAALDETPAYDVQVIASVVRGSASLFASSAEDHVKTVIVDATASLGITVGVPKPDTVGIDRLLMSGEAFSNCGGAVITVGVGTAITVDVVTSAGVYVGGSISPGLRLASWALSEGTSLLPEVDIDEALPDVPRSTMESIRMGIVEGAAGSVDRLVSSLAGGAGLDTYKVVLTGGDAGLLSERLATEHEVLDDLLFQGLAHTYERLSQSV